MALMLITHDLGVVAEMADEVVVMYAGQGGRAGRGAGDFRQSEECRTRAGLLNSIPTLSKDPTGKVKKKRLETIPGIVPNLLHLPQGLPFSGAMHFRRWMAAAGGAGAERHSRMTAEKACRMRSAA